MSLFEVDAPLRRSLPDVLRSYLVVTYGGCAASASIATSLKIRFSFLFIVDAPLCRPRPDVFRADVVAICDRCTTWLVIATSLETGFGRYL